MSTSETTTRDIEVLVHARPAQDRSVPSRGLWFFLYTIKITNRGSEPVQLLSRHWVITDAMGQVEEVTGDGVVGERPHLKPGQSFEYTSGCPLKTPFGSMEGSYTFRTDGGQRFEAQIAPFALNDPESVQ